MISGFFRQVQERLENFSQDSIESLIEVYANLLRAKAKIKKTRKLSLKFLRKQLKIRGLSLESNFFPGKFLKTLLFLLDYLVYIKNVEPNSLQTIEEIRKHLETQLKSPLVDYFLQTFSDNKEYASKNKKDISQPISLEFNLIPIIIYFGLLKSSVPVMIRDLGFWIRNGWIPYVSKETPEFTATNYPSISFLRKKALGFYEKMEGKLGFSFERLDYQISRLFLEGLNLPLDGFLDIFVRLSRKIGIFSKGVSEISLAAILIFLMKLIYGLNNNGFTSLLKPEDAELLLKICPQESDSIRKSIKTREIFKKHSFQLKFLGDIAGIDAILMKMHEILKADSEKGKNMVYECFPESFADLKEAHSNNFEFLGEVTENSEFTDLTSIFLDERNKPQTEKISIFLPVNKPTEEKFEIAKFLKEEVVFLGNIKESDKKLTVFPLPSSYFMKAGTIDRKNKEFCLALDFFSKFLEESPTAILAELKTIERVAIQ